MQAGWQTAQRTPEMFDHSSLYSLVDHAYQPRGQNCTQLVFNLKREENEIPEEGGPRRHMHRAKLAIHFHTASRVSDVNLGFRGCNTACDRDELRANIHVRLRFQEIPPFP